MRRGAGTEIPQGGATVEFIRVGGGVPPPGGKRGPPGIHPRTCAPVVARSLWRLPASQRRVAPGRGNRGRRFMAELLAPARCSVSKLVCHALWRGRAPLHVNLGCGMVGGTQEDLELRDIPHLRPRRSYKYVGRPQGPRDTGQDHTADGPLREGPPCRPDGGRRGGRVRQGGQGRLRKRGGGKKPELS